MYICRSRDSFTCQSKNGSRRSKLGHKSVFHHTNCRKKRTHTSSICSTGPTACSIWQTEKFYITPESERNSCELNDFEFSLENSSLLVSRIGIFYINHWKGHMLTCKLIQEGSFMTRVISKFYVNVQQSRGRRIKWWYLRIKINKEADFCSLHISSCANRNKRQNFP